MKVNVAIGFALILILSSCSTKPIKHEVQTSHVEMVNGERMLIGDFTQNELMNEFTIFKASFDSYQPSQNAIDFLKSFSNNLSIETYLGTWCSDSKRDVPPFLKIFAMANNPHIQCHLHGVDRTKRDKNGETSRLGISHVPTMIFYVNGKELGRIVENPFHETLEEDILDILSKQR
ncbi:thioredoxin family protein [bacterium]|nr:thioredoxin family protein [bacterium]